MRKQSKLFCKDKESLFKTLKKLTDYDYDKDCKISKTLSIKTQFTHLSHVSCLLSYVNHSKRDSVSKEFSVNSDINNLIISLIRHESHTQKFLKGLQGAIKRYIN